MVAISETRRQRRTPLRYILDRAEALGPILLAPATLYIAIIVLVGLPCLLVVYYSLSAYTVYNPSYHFVGLRNFIAVVHDPVFRRTLANTFIFTFGSLSIGLVLGKFGALLLLRPSPGRRVVRALIILPWAVPVALATVAWEWMFHRLYSVINWTLMALGLVSRANAPQWLGDPHLALLCVIIVNAWRFFPFAIVIFLAGITAVPQDVIDAATVDGAGFWRRNYQIIVPIIAPIVAIGLVFGIVFTFTDLSVVYLLTNGGPINATQVIGNLGFLVGITDGGVAQGAAVSLYMFPVLLFVVVVVRYIQRQDI
jgi:multiple sugar transport system permease protein